MALQRSELVRQFPLFSDLDDPSVKQLARALSAQYVNPGEVILRPDSTARSVYFIATGAVELERGGQTWRLGRGEMFGQLAILTEKPRRFESRAIVPSTLLVLDEARFRRLLKRSETLREATEWMTAQKDMNERFAGAVPYLRAFARVLGGHLHLQAAMAEKAAGGSGAREKLARFYIQRLLPEHQGLLAHAQAGAEDLYALDVEDLRS